MRLIDAERLEKRLLSEEPNDGWDEFHDGFDRMKGIALNAIDATPTIDAVPVVRGEWIVTDAYPHRVYCSLCYKTNVPNEEWLYEKNDYPKYCMWCGAKMGEV